MKNFKNYLKIINKVKLKTDTFKYQSERRQSLRSFIFVNTLYEVINMLTIRKENFRDDEINVILDGLVPENHLVRKIENTIDFSFIYDKVKDLYSPLGAPSIDPVVLIKIVLIQYLFGIPSMRQTIREIEVNVAYRWFLGYSLTEKIPHFSTFNKNYERRFKNTDLFEDECVLKNSLAISESELKSIISKELKNMENTEINDFISSLLDLYKIEILNQDKKAYRSIIQEIKQEDTSLQYFINMDLNKEKDGILSFNELVEKGKEERKNGNKGYDEVKIDNEKMSVLLGIATYSYKRFKEIYEHQLFNSISGRSCVRVLIEDYIMMKYLVKNETSHDDIWRDYQLYGMGLYKLVLARHRENGALEESHFDEKYIEALVNEFKGEEFIDMDTKYFDKQNIRLKAEDVGEKNLYGLYYDYDSSFEHGLWGAIRESSLLKCNNPAHKYHCVPDVEDETRLKTVLPDCIMIMNKTISFLDEIYGIPEQLLNEVINFEIKPIAG